MAALNELKRELDRQLRCRLPEPDKWECFRVDFCYAWDMGSERNARLCIEALKHLHFPRKKPHIYDSSIMFAGNTYSIKFYRKHPEFRQHDLPALLSSGADLEWVNHWENLAKPIVRYEATLRRKYLKRHQLANVADLQNQTVSFRPCGEWMEDDRLKSLLACLIIYRHLVIHHRMHPEIPLNSNQMFTMSQFLDAGSELREPAGLFLVCVLTTDDGSLILILELDESAIVNLTPDPLGSPLPCWHCDCGTLGYGRIFHCDGSRSLVTIKKSVSEVHLEKFLAKFLGVNRGMQHQDQVQALLFEKYGSNKAANLYAFWLLARNVGTAKAKEMLGDRTFYRRKSDLKSAGVSLVEPLKIVGGTEAEILKEFEFRIPSVHVANKVDDFRDSESVINLDEQRLRRLYGTT